MQLQCLEIQISLVFRQWFSYHSHLIPCSRNFCFLHNFTDGVIKKRKSQMKSDCLTVALHLWFFRVWFHLWFFRVSKFSFDDSSMFFSTISLCFWLAFYETYVLCGLTLLMRVCLKKILYIKYLKNKYVLCYLFNKNYKDYATFNY